MTKNIASLYDWKKNTLNVNLNIEFKSIKLTLQCTINVKLQIISLEYF